MSRQDRLKAALRDNLKRRKAQARDRADAAEDAGGPERSGPPEPRPSSAADRDTP